MFARSRKNPKITQLYEEKYMKNKQTKIQVGFLLVLTFLIALHAFSINTIFNVNTNTDITTSTMQSADGRSQNLTSQEIQQILHTYPVLQQSLKQKSPTQKRITLPFTGFIKNIGQKKTSNVDYYYTATNMSIGFGQSTIYFQYNQPGTSGKILAFSLTFPGSNSVTPTGNKQMQYTINYFIGNDQYSGIPAFQEIYYYNLYPHIDLRYYMTEQGLKYEFIVNPGGNPAQITIQVNGAVITDISDNNVFLSPIESPNSYFTFDENLTIYQSLGKIIKGNFIPKVQTNSYGFTIGDFNTNTPLIIDPYVLGFSTYLGGTGNDQGYAIAVDASGNTYVTGSTSGNFPTINAYNNTFGGFSDIFVTKFNTTGNGLVFSTYLGGTGDDEGYGIAVDTTGNVYVTGYTQSSDFPTKNAYNANYNGGGIADVFVTKLNVTGNGLVFSTYLGGTGNDEGYGIAVDTAGNAYVTGYTNSGNFPTENAYNASFSGIYDTFATEISPISSTYLGGTGSDYGYGIATDTVGNIYVTGYTNSGNFPTVNAYNTSFGGGYDTFVTKLNATGNGLVFSTYLGGTGNDEGYGITVDTTGNVYVTGSTTSNNFPTKNAYNSTFGGLNDVFVTKLNATGNGLVFST